MNSGLEGQGPMHAKHCHAAAKLLTPHVWWRM